MFKQRTSERETARDDDYVTASEVAAYAYCAKAWHLEYVLGQRPTAPAMERRDAGTNQHLMHGTRVARLQRSGRVLRLAVALFVIAAILLAAFLLSGA